MLAVRTFIAALLFLAWLPATNSCLLAAAYPEKISDCCGEESGASGTTCDKCATLENGCQRSQLQPLTVETPVFVEIFSLSEILSEMARAVSDEPPPAEVGDSPLLRLWTFVVSTALPVRAPSLAA